MKSITAFLLLILFVLVVAASASSYDTHDTTTTTTTHDNNDVDIVIDLPDVADNKDDDDSLVLGYYHETCPDIEKIIYNKVKQSYVKDNTVAPALIRLHFHDCAVRGCDASILLDHDGSEKSANASKTLRGFELIDEIKAELEKECPKTVSCADILTAAARDATILAGGPFWSVPYGRKDGRESHAHEADQIVPSGRESVTDQIEFYQSKGLNILDLVALSGAHTIGRSSCGSMQYRVFNYQGTGKADPSICPKYLNYLKRKCRWASEPIALDAVTPDEFDNQYYKNLQDKRGLLYSDQALYSDLRTAPLVNAFASASELFRHQFAASMVKLGNIQDYYNSDDDQIRLKCSCVNDEAY